MELVRLAQRVPLVLMEILARQVQVETTGQPAPLVLRELMETQAPQVLPDQQGHQE